MTNSDSAKVAWHHLPISWKVSWKTRPYPEPSHSSQKPPPSTSFTAYSSFAPRVRDRPIVVSSVDLLLVLRSAVVSASCHRQLRHSPSCVAHIAYCTCACCTFGSVWLWRRSSDSSGVRSLLLLCIERGFPCVFLWKRRDVISREARLDLRLTHCT